MSQDQESNIQVNRPQNHHVKLWRMTDTVQKPAYFTPWSFFHIFSGIMASVLLRRFRSLSDAERFLIWLNVGVVYEIKDIYGTYIRTQHPHDYNTFANSMGDIVCDVVGFMIGDALFTKTNNSRDLILVAVYCICFLYLENHPELG